MTHTASSLRILAPYLRERKWSIALGLSSLIVVDFLQLYIPRIIREAVDSLTLLKITPKALAVFGIEIFLVGLLIGVFRYLWRGCLMGAGRRVEEGVRGQLFSHLQTLSPAYFDTITTGDIMAHAVNDITSIRMGIGMGLVALTDSVVMGGATLCFMAYINVPLMLLALIPSPFIILGTRFFSRRMHRLYGKVQGDFSTLTETIRERFSGIRLIKAHGSEEQEIKAVEDVSRRYIRSNLSLARIDGAFFPMMVLFTNLSAAIVLYFGGGKAIIGTITPGDFVAFMSYLNLLTWPMMALGWVTNLIQRGKASLDRLQVIFSTEPRVAEKPDAKPLSAFAGSIDLAKVSFAYGIAPVLREISFSIAPGRMLGIVGPPGSGKTALLSLLPRLYDPTEGILRVDGKDIRNLRLQDLRSRIAVVPQEPFLFAGTIRENILLDPSKYSEEDLIAACREAALHETILSFPGGYDTLVGEKGIVLSGGQKQRVALARAFACNAPILILDDPVSQVDTRTGQKIIDAIRKKAEGKTILIASHRLSALSFADQILTLTEGRITESGTHDTLLAKGGYYAETWRMQELEGVNRAG